MLLPALADEERPVNFIFLIDVSGSMLFKSEMVTARDGSQVTLFEALRQALVQIAQDQRLINSKSKISFVTFGTKITEKSDWPAKLSTDADRQSLIKVLQSSDALSADKHGDTYMGGALHLALDKANQMYSQAEPCTTTFIVMLTDGWDEPPKDATVKVREVAAQLSSKQKELFSRIGAKTLNVLVIGLQRLPDKKVGTTTAKELADLLGGGFIDVSKSAGGTVSERIFLALKNQVEQLKGQLALGSGSALKSGVIDFGTVNGNGSAKASFPLELNSCYPEEISAATDASRTTAQGKMNSLVKTAGVLTGGACSSAAALPADAITLSLAQSQYIVAPKNGDDGKRKVTQEEIAVNVQAHSNCPAGVYAGCLKLASSAKVPDAIPWVIRVPGRVVVEPDSMKVKVRKPGFFWAEATEVDLTGKFKELPGAHAQANYDVQIVAGTANLHSDHETTIEATIPSEAINDGKPLSFSVDTGKTDSHEFKLTVAIPGKQKPGKYEGVLALKVSGPAETVAPSEIPFQITVEPSPWEEVAPIAIPIFICLVLVVSFCIFLWASNPRRSD